MFEWMYQKHDKRQNIGDENLQKILNKVKELNGSNKVVGSCKCSCKCGNAQLDDILLANRGIKWQ